MTDLSRGARARRGGRRPGWVLLTALLVLAIGASSALVFTNRVELLKLAVILALWAAVVAAFVSVIYRRQSDVDQARARDLKLVYDLQLDREISARREYELTVESQLRRELASELRAHSADEVSALRAELAALRTNLEILFDAELSERPALETERRTVRGYSDWDREHESARERVNRVTSVRAEEPRRLDDSTIIDVPEEPLVPSPRQPVADSYQAAAYAYQPAGAHEGSGANPAADPYEAAEADRSAHRRRGDRAARAQQDESTPPTGWAAPGPSPVGGAERQPEGRGWAQPQTAEANGWAASSGPSPAGAGGRHEPQPARRSHRRHETPPQPEPRFVPPPAPPGPPPEQQRPEWSAPADAPRRAEAPVGWQPVGSEGQWVPAGAPGSNWIAESGDNTGTGSWYDAASREGTLLGSPNVSEPMPAPSPPVERRGRHSNVTEPADQTGKSNAGWREPGRRAGARHSAESSAYSDSDVLGSATPAPAMSPPPPPMPPSPPSPADREPVMSPPPSAPPPPARHRSTDPLDTDAPPSGGQSVAELLARLQSSPSGGGRRRRRED
jgi:hypothetical protein